MDYKDGATADSFEATTTQASATKANLALSQQNSATEPETPSRRLSNEEKSTPLGALDEDDLMPARV